MKQIIMRKALIAATVVATLGANGVAGATEVTPEEKRVGKGFGLGAAIGSLVAGPPGLVVGSILGAIKVQQDIRDERLREAEALRIELEASLVEARSEAAELKRNLVASAENRVHQETAIDVTPYSLRVLFRTASHELSEADRKRLIELADWLKRHETFTVHLEGFSDPRGDEAYNLKLSEQRAEAVRQLLLEQGVDETRIETVANGESRSVASEEDFDGLAFERRVSVSIRSDAGSRGVARLDL
ncbi:MAG: hypothetical protein Kow006_05970 [Gammaproteobacteria bacterium]